MYRKDRCNFKQGKAGGVLLYIRNEIISYDFQELNNSQSESVWCKLKVDRNDSVTIGVCYRSQIASDKELSELFTVIKRASQDNALIMGDFNCPKINWDTLDCDAYIVWHLEIYYLTVTCSSMLGNLQDWIIYWI